MPTRTITGTIKRDDDSPWVLGTVKFALREPFSTSLAVYPNNEVIKTLDTDGAFIIDLAVPDSGTAHYEITLPDKSAYTCFIAAGPATDLLILINLTGSPVSQDAIQTAIDAYATVLDTRYEPLSYPRQVKNLFGSRIVSHFRMVDPAGTVLLDAANGYHGAYNGPTLAAEAAPIYGEFAPTFDGVGDDVNVFTAASAVPIATAGAFMGWAKIPAAVWVDGVSRLIISIYNANGSDFIQIAKDTVHNQLSILFVYGGVNKSFQVPFYSEDWFTWCITWDKAADKLDFYLNGYLAYIEQSGLGTWSGLLFTGYVRLGGFGGGISPFIGSQSNVVFLNSFCTQPEFMQFTDMAQHLPVLSVIGDSIAATWGTWPFMVAKQTGYILKDHAIAGTNIKSQMISQAAATARDRAALVILALGTNDDNAHAAGLQAILEASIDTIRANNPDATLFYLNVLPRWTDTGGGTPVDKANIRAAIAAACASRSVTCWDTFTSSWITAIDTDDGIHPF